MNNYEMSIKNNIEELKDTLKFYGGKMTVDQLIEEQLIIPSDEELYNEFVDSNSQFDECEYVSFLINKRLNSRGDYSITICDECIYLN